MGFDKLKIINDIKPQERSTFTDDNLITKQDHMKQPLETPSSKMLTPTLSKLSLSACPPSNFKSANFQPPFKPPIDNNKAVLMRKDSERIFKNSNQELKTKHSAKRKLSQQEILFKN